VKLNGSLFDRHRQSEHFPRRPVAFDGLIVRLRSVHCLLLHGQVRVEVGLRGVCRFVAEPERDGCDVGSCFEHPHGGGVTKHMGRDVFSGETGGQPGCGGCGIDAKPGRYGVPADRCRAPLSGE
jgi:hypothetical protein